MKADSFDWINVSSNLIFQYSKESYKENNLKQADTATLGGGSPSSGGKAKSIWLFINCLTLICLYFTALFALCAESGFSFSGELLSYCTSLVMFYLYVSRPSKVVSLCFVTQCRWHITLPLGFRCGVVLLIERTLVTFFN